MRRVVAILTSAFIVSPLGAIGASAATPNDVPASVTSVCVTGQPKLDQGCVDAVCTAVETSGDWSDEQQTAFGTYLAGLVGDYGMRDPDGSDALQACVARGPDGLITAFETNLGDSVATIGTRNSASEQ